MRQSHFFLSVIAVYLLTAAIAPVLIALEIIADPYAINPALSLHGSDWSAPLGYDLFGRSLLSRLLLALHHSAIVIVLGLIVAQLGSVLALLGWAWQLTRPVKIMVITNFSADLILAIPLILIALLLSQLTGQNHGSMAMAIGAALIPIFYRLVQACLIPISSHGYVASAVAMGAGFWHLLIVHGLPATARPLIVMILFQSANIALIEAGLSYLGLSIPPPEPTLGRLLAESQTLFGLSPRQLLVPLIPLMLWTIAGNRYAELLKPLPASAAKPGRSRPSRYSRKAPPAKETWVNAPIS